MKNNKNAFTLVELIVVITILAILATVWFVSFSWYLAWTRDTNRIAQLKSMSDALELYRTKKDLPIPDDKIDVQANGTTIAYQWYIWANVLETIEYTEKGLDPKDKTYFSYYLTKNKKHYQLLSFLEEANEDVLAWNNNVFNSTRAVDYSDRVVHVKWKKLWVITDDENTPIQDLTSITSDWYLDIINTADQYKIFYTDEDVLSWTWKTLKTIVGWSKLVWLFDFEWITWTEVLDKSSKWNNWTLSWTTLPTVTTWVSWNALSFPWTWDTGGLIDIRDNSNDLDEWVFTYNFWIKPNAQSNTDGFWNSHVIKNFPSGVWDSEIFDLHGIIQMIILNRLVL